MYGRTCWNMKNIANFGQQEGIYSLFSSCILLCLDREVRLYVFIHAYFVTVELREKQLNIRRNFVCVCVSKAGSFQCSFLFV